jgi:hypothetical protein
MGLIKLPLSAMEVERTAVGSDSDVLLKDDLTRSAMKLPKEGHYLEITHKVMPQE